MEGGGGGVGYEGGEGDAGGGCYEGMQSGQHVRVLECAAEGGAEDERVT